MIYCTHIVQPSPESTRDWNIIPCKNLAVLFLKNEFRLIALCMKHFEQNQSHYESIYADFKFITEDEYCVSKVIES